MSFYKFNGKNSKRRLNCTHIRVRDDNDYDIDVENFIKSIETKFHIDFRSLPQWKEIIQRLHVATTDYNRTIQGSKLRKSLIIDKIYTQSTRLSPFQLTDDFARTAKRWDDLEVQSKKRKHSLIVKSESISCIEEEISEGRISDSGPPNTEVVSDTELVVPPAPSSQVDVATDSGLDSLPRLPLSICTNQHKLISPADSKYSQIKKKCIAIDIASIESEQNEWLLLNPTSSLISSPTEIYLRNDSLNQQSVQFSLTNCSTEYIHIRFKSVMEEAPFREAKIIPVTPLRLYPGIAVVYKFVFRLRKQQDFTSGLFFKVGHNIYANAPTEAFCVPIISTFKEPRSVSVSKIVSIAPTYLWQISTSRHPTGILSISVNDPYSYHLHIYIRKIDLAKESDESLSFLEETSVKMESEKEFAQYLDSKSRSKMTSPATDTKSRGNISSRSAENTTKSRAKTSATPTAKSPSIHQNDIEETETLEAISSIVSDVVELALEAFVFKHTYLHLQPHSNRRIPVYFTKAEHIGKHQYLYDLEFLSPETEEILFTETIKVFAEILPHPIQIYPGLLDMSQSPITHGFFEDRFVVTNNHNLYPVTIKIKLTTKMNKLFHINPMETVVPSASSINFEVKFCSGAFSRERSDDAVIFTFKIIIVGCKSLYENVPPIFYEMIAPIAAGDFKKIYSEKFYRDVSELCT